MFREAECKPLSWCPWRTWPVWHNHTSKNFSRTSTKNGKNTHIFVNFKISSSIVEFTSFITLCHSEQVKWIRVLYSDFSAFIRDQEHLISAEKTFDYIEGFVIINKTGLLNNWRSSFNPQDPVQANQFQSDGRTLYCLELAKNINLEKDDIIYVITLTTNYR